MKIPEKFLKPLDRIPEKFLIHEVDVLLKLGNSLLGQVLLVFLGMWLVVTFRWTSIDWMGWASWVIVLYSIFVAVYGAACKRRDRQAIRAAQEIMEVRTVEGTVGRD
jgi:hypothetical protein